LVLWTAEPCSLVDMDTGPSFPLHHIGVTFHYSFVGPHDHFPSNMLKRPRCFLNL
jgi:hypothetical protein